MAAAYLAQIMSLFEEVSRRRKSLAAINMCLPKGLFESVERFKKRGKVRIFWLEEKRWNI